MLLNYKDTLYWFTPGQRPSESDNLLCEMGGHTYPELYKKSYELFSAISFAEKSQVLLGGGFTDVRIVGELKNMNIRQIETRLFAVNEVRAFLPAIAIARTDLQETLLRLFRQAYSAVDPYSRLLFYWHTLVYPEKDKSEKAAVDFINDHYAEIKSLLPEYRTEATQRLFSNVYPETDLGTYIKVGARHSVAHIVRDWKDYNSLEIDSLTQVWHVNYLADILEELCRLRLTKYCDIKIGNDRDVVQFLECKPVT